MNCLKGRVIGAAIAIVTLDGCVYALRPPSPPAQFRLRVAAKSPEEYSVLAWDKNYQVGADGKVVIDIPAMRQPCKTSFFGFLPISRSADPRKPKSISLITAGTTVKALSLLDLRKLPVEGSGEHLLAVAAGR